MTLHTCHQHYKLARTEVIKKPFRHTHSMHIHPENYIGAHVYAELTSSNTSPSYIEENSGTSVGHSPPHLVAYYCSRWQNLLDDLQFVNCISIYYK